MGSSWNGGNPLSLLLLLLLCLAVSGKLGGPDAGEPRDLLCYKQCCTAQLVVCRWKARNASKANYTLNLRYQEDQGNSRTFQAGEATSFSFRENEVSALTNVTIWVENHAEDPILISEKLTMQISEVVKFDAPNSTAIEISKVDGRLTLKWHKPTYCSPIKKEARMWHREDAKWTSGNCDATKEEDDGTIGKLVVLCHVDKNIPQEVQVRYGTSHWSSHWSDWSEPIFVPAEIHESPEVTYTVGELGSDGLRNLTLEWEKPSLEQGEVTYNLTFDLLPCRCAERKNFSLRSRTSYRTALCGAGYNISLQAWNKAGGAPPFTFHLPPADGDSGPPFLSRNLSGKYVMVHCVAKMDVEEYCFEEQPLDAALQEKPCTKIEEDLSPVNITLNSGTLEPNRCYRLAVHALDFGTDVWSTVAFTHVFFRNSSLEDPIQVHVTNRTTDSAVLRWEPPKALSTCPSVLKEYVICCRNEQTRDMTYYEANASETHYTILGLQPKTFYRVGVWASTTQASTGEGASACHAHEAFQTNLPEPKQVTSAHGFWYAGIFGGLVAAIGIFYLVKKRAKKVLCSALPDPANTEAVKIAVATETTQVRPQRGFIEPLESSNPTEPFLVELPSKEELPGITKVDSPGRARAVEEFLPPKEDQGGSTSVLPLEYNSQGLLSPVDVDQQGQEGWKDSLDTRAGCSVLSAKEVNVGGSTEPAPLSLMLLDTVMVIRNSGD